MKHFKEILLTIGASKVDLLREAEYWDFWSAEYFTPAGTMTGFYLYLKYKCNFTVANNSNFNSWFNLSEKKGYDVIVTPLSELFNQKSKTLEAFRANKLYTTKQLIYENFLKDFQYVPITCEEYFVNPTLQLETGNYIQSTLEYLMKWINGSITGTKNATIASLVAHGGIGKTTVARELSKALHKIDSSIIPILVEAEQWRHLISGSLSLSNVLDEAITHRFNNAARLLSNQTAFRVLVRERIFVIIFDGFDELCVQPNLVNDPQNIINELIHIQESEDESIQSKIIITSRITYWDALQEEIDFKNIEIFHLRGFDNDQRKKYFTRRLDDPSERDSALRISKEIGGAIYEGVSTEKQNYEKLSGVPFILDLIAQHVYKNDEIGFTPYKVDPLSSLLTDICSRENRRQELNIDPEKQMELFEEIFRDEQEEITLANLKLHLEIFCNISDKSIVKRFSNHPFLVRKANNCFSPRYEVLKVYFIARFLANRLIEYKEHSPKLNIAKLLAKHHTGKTQVIDWIVKQLKILNKELVLVAINHAIEIINDKETISVRSESFSTLFHIISNLIEDTDKVNRTTQLIKFYNVKKNKSNLNVFEKVIFVNIVKSFDFRNTIFKKCQFDFVEFKNCIFDQHTIFDGCLFDGTLQFINCSEEGNVSYNDCKLSKEAEYTFDTIKKSPTRIELKRSFAEDVLLRSLRKFRKNNIYIPISEQYKKASFKAGNPYNEKIWQELYNEKIVEFTGAKETGIVINQDKDIRREVSSFLDNGVVGKNLSRVVVNLIS